MRGVADDCDRARFDKLFCIFSWNRPPQGPKFASGLRGALKIAKNGLRQGAAALPAEIGDPGREHHTCQCREGVTSQGLSLGRS